MLRRHSARNEFNNESRRSLDRIILKHTPTTSNPFTQSFSPLIRQSDHKMKTIHRYNNSSHYFLLLLYGMKEERRERERGDSEKGLPQKTGMCVGVTLFNQASKRRQSACITVPPTHWNLVTLKQSSDTYQHSLSLLRLLSLDYGVGCSFIFVLLLLR